MSPLFPGNGEERSVDKFQQIPNFAMGELVSIQFGKSINAPHISVAPSNN